MIQRIQTVYLFLVIVLCISCLFAGVGEWTLEGETVASMSNFTYSKEGLEPATTAPCYGLGVLLILVVLLTIPTILLFRKRMRQLRLAIFSTILLVGYVALYVFYAWAFTAEGTTFRFLLPATFPVVSIVLNALAIHGIRKDEALVRSLDRLR